MKFLNHNLFTGDITVNGTTTLSTATGITRATGDNSTHLATTAFVKAQGYATTAALSGYVPTSRTLTINGTTYDLSANRSWTISSADGYISNVQVVGSTLSFTGVGSAFSGVVDLSTLIPTVRTVYETVKNVSGATILKGTPLAVVAGQTSGNVSDVVPADAADPTKMPAVFIANENIADEAEGEAVLFGYFSGVDTSLYQSGTTVYVAPGGGWTATKPVYPNKIQNLGVITKQHATNGAGIVTGVGRANDLPNLTAGKIWVGTANYPIESTTVHIDEANARLGIGTTSPTEKLHVNGRNILVGDLKIGRANSVDDSGGDAVLAIGKQALNIYTGNTSNMTAVGDYALAATTNSGTSNDAFGYKALFENTTGTYNSAFGQSAGRKNNGTQNVFFGQFSGPYYATLTGGYNTFIGPLSGIQSNGAAAKNTGIGASTLYSLTTGIENVAISSAALFDVTTGSGNIGIGFNTGRGITTGSYNIVIGNNVTGLSATLANNIIIADGQGNRRINVDASGNVGIGTTSPSKTLHVYTSGNEGIFLQGATGGVWMDMQASGGLIHSIGAQVGGMGIYNRSGGVYNMFITDGGNAGFGTTNPTEKLHVGGRVRINTIDNGTGDFATISGTGVITRRTAAQVLSDIGAQPSGSYLTAEADTLATVTARGASTNTSITVGPDLVVQADGGVNYTASRLKLNSHNNYRGAGMHLTGVDSNWFVGTPYTDFAGGFVIARKGAAASFEDTAQYSNALFTVKSDGNVGIGTASPSEKLHVAGAALIDNYLYLDSNEIWAKNGGDLFVKADNKVYIQPAATTTAVFDTNGNFGIGTTSPNAKLEVNGNIKLSSTAGSTATPSNIWLGNDYSNGTTRDKLKIYLYNSGTEQYGFSVGPTSDVQYHSNILHDFYVANSLKVRINGSGNLGIGTASPIYKLDVAGAIRLTGSLVFDDLTSNLIQHRAGTDVNTLVTVGHGGFDHNGYLRIGGVDVATQTYVNTAIANLVDSAPSTLDTLNELAAALGDDPNFATTVTNSIATKLPLAGGTMTGQILTPSIGTGVYDGAIQLREYAYVNNTQTAWGYSPAITFHWGNITVKRFGMRSDGQFAIDDAPLALQSWVTSQGYTTNTGTVTSVSGTGGYGGLTLSGTVTSSGNITLGGTPTGTWPISVSGNAATATSATSATSATQVVTLQDDAPAGVNGKLWWETDTGKLKVYYGASSAWVDALPMPDMTLYLSTAGGAISGDLSIAQTLTVTGNILSSAVITASGGNSTQWNTAYGWGNHASAGYLTSLPAHTHDDRYYTETESDAKYLIGTTNPSTPGNFTLSIGNNGTYSYVQSHSSQPLRLNPLGNALEGPSGSTIWHSGNDGADSGLDADLLDGQHGSYYAAASSLSSYLPLTGGTLSGAVVVNLGNVSSDTVAFKVGGPSNYDSLTIGMEDTPDYDAFIASYGNDIRFYSGKAVTTENHSFYWFTSKAGTSQHSSVAMVLDHNQALSVTGVINASGGNSTNWNTAYGWGNHASAGYLTGYTETDTLQSVTSRGATTSIPITVTAGEGREVAVYMPSSYTTDDLVSGHEYGWYNDHWRLGMTRSGGAAGADFVVQWNGARRLSLSNGGNLTVTGTISATNFSGSSSGTNTGDQTTITGNAGSATILQTTRAINGTNFNGSADITTATWGTARTITIGNTGKSINGGGDVAWTLAEIGAYAATNPSGYITSSSNITGNAATSSTFASNRTNYKGTTDNAVAGQLMWKNYGNGHTIFDASNSTSPDGGAVNNTNSDVPWTGTYPTLMGWNGTNTYGVRVDSARSADVAGNANTLGGWQPQEYIPYHSGSDFVDGTLVVTNIDASVTNGDSFVMELTGKSYGSGPAPFALLLEGYIYNNTFINTGAISYGSWFPGPIKVLNYNGNLAFWWARGSYWNSFSVTVREAGGSSRNKVTSISNSTEPSSAKKVSVNVIQSLNSSNYNSWVPTLTGTGANGTWSINVTGTAGGETLATVTGRGASTSTDLTFNGTLTMGTGGTQYIRMGRFPASLTNNGEAWIGRASDRSTGTMTVQLGNDAARIFEIVDHAWSTVILNVGMNSFSYKGNTIWHAGNDGAGSGLDADLLDGNHASAFYLASNPSGYITGNQTITLSGDVSGSGTTSISVTVNNIDGWGFVNTGSNSATNADTINSNGISYYTGGVTNFSGNATDGALYSQRYSDNWQHQIAGDYRSGMIAVRGKNNGTWTSWKTIIDSSTIGSQSVAYATSAGSATSATSASSATSATQVVTIQDNPPSGSNGQLWWESDTGKLKVYYGSSSAWVDATPVPDMSLYYAKAGGPISGDVTIQQTLTVVGNTLVQGTLTETSDISLKENIVPLESSLDKVMQLNGVSFNKKATPNVKEIGFIAQEVEAVIPDLVTETSEGIKTVSYSRVTAVLVETIKEQQAQIEELKNMVNMLAEKLNNL